MRLGRGEIMDWDKLRIFQAAADAGSFTHAGELMGLSQSAVSRQVSALEQDLGTPLFHRHARGLILTEQGELLLNAVQDVVLKLEAARSRLIDSRDKPHGELRVTTTLGFGAIWLSPRLGEFLDSFNAAVISFLDQARVVFLQQTGDPVAAQQLAGQALENLRQQQASSLAYFDVFLVLAVVTLALAPVVLLMKRSVAEKGAHIGHE